MSIGGLNNWNNNQHVREQMQNEALEYQLRENKPQQAKQAYCQRSPNQSTNASAAHTGRDTAQRHTQQHKQDPPAYRAAVPPEGDSADQTEEDQPPQASPQKPELGQQAYSAVHPTQRRPQTGLSPGRRVSGKPVGSNQKQKIHQEIQKHHQFKIDFHAVTHILSTKMTSV